MKTWLALLVVAAFSVPCWGQSNPPPWPDIHLTACPSIASISQRTWKHGQVERDALMAATKSSVKDPKEAGESLEKFVEKYPDSDFRGLALTEEWMAYGMLRDASGQLRVAESMVALPSADPMTRTMGFVTLGAVLSPYVLPDDSDKPRKLADLDRWTQCGAEALAAEVKSPDAAAEGFEKVRRQQESWLDRTAGFVALMRQEYSLADSKLRAAASVDPQDPLTYLWLFESKALSPNPDMNGAIFYLARQVELAPQVKQGPDVLKRVYVLAHGSAKGLSDVKKLAKANTEPPPGFNVLRQLKEKHHYGSGIAVAAAIGLLAYVAVAHPSTAAGFGNLGNEVGTALAPTAPAKLMIFGGPGHRTYLGCLTCGEFAPDSVLNPMGRYGSRFFADSIWNSLGQYGSVLSVYSACNPLATDPPVIVDQNGNAYGRLTVNRYSPQIGAGARLYAWLASDVCGQ